MNRYEFNGMYNPKASDFLPEGDVKGFMEQCAVRLLRVFPDARHAANLAAQIRVFGNSYKVKAETDDDADDERGELQEEIESLEDELSEVSFESSLPE